ncbi:hypothetical protein [Exiguobacterium flavidum]|uniref:hypothetical protein n=1 Tax=Exiguobacterium flavidum TaxID=2184695 RepID=UPI000DF8624B|nr:hypothetical protein [Exiguobacterium flavidum]
MTKNRFYLAIAIFLVSVLLVRFAAVELYTAFFYDPAKMPPTYRNITNKVSGGEEIPGAKGSDKIFGPGERGNPLYFLIDFSDSPGSNGMSGFGRFPWILLLVIPVAYYLFRRWRNRKKHKKPQAGEEWTDESFEVPAESSAPPTIEEADTRIRRAVQRLHMSLPGSRKKLPEETLSEWFERIGFASTSPVYHAHRYGELNEHTFSEFEIGRFEADVDTYLSHHPKGGTYS